MLGGLVVYSNEAKRVLAGVPATLIEDHGAVSPEVATALAAGARARLGAEIGIGITGIAGARWRGRKKPIGTVCLSVGTKRPTADRTVDSRAGGTDVRDRTRRGAAHAPPLLVRA